MKERGTSLGKTENLSRKEKILGKQLFVEGMLYQELKQNATIIGTHLSFMLHRKGRIVSIHFREGLEELEKYKDRPIKMMKEFLGNIRGDLGQLALMLDEDPRLLNVKEIWGLCNLSARWGERHGFITKTWSRSSEKIAKFEQSIMGKPNIDGMALNQPLSLFIHNRDNFKSEFLK
jgi:hypothetical protein